MPLGEPNERDASVAALESEPEPPERVDQPGHAQEQALADFLVSGIFERQIILCHDIPVPANPIQKTPTGFVRLTGFTPKSR